MLQQNWISTVFFLSAMLHNQMLTQDYLVLVTVTKVGQASAVKDIQRCLDDGRDTKLNSANTEFHIRRG